MDIYTKEFWLLEDLATVWSQEPGKLSKKEIEHKFWESYWLGGFIDKESKEEFEIQLLKVYIDKNGRDVPELLNFTSRADLADWLHRGGVPIHRVIKKSNSNIYNEEDFKTIAQMKLSFSNLKMNENLEIFFNKAICKCLGINRNDLLDWCKRNNIPPPKALINPNLKDEKRGRPNMTRYLEIKPKVFEAFDTLYGNNPDQINTIKIPKIQTAVKEYLGKKSSLINAHLPATTLFSQWVNKWREKKGVKRKKRIYTKQ